MAQPHTPLVDQVRPLLRAGHLEAIAPLALHHNAADVAALLRGLEPHEAAHVFSALSPEQRAETFEHLDPEAQQDLVGRLDRQVLAGVLDEMSSDDRGRFFRHLPGAVREHLLPLLAQAQRNDVRRLMAFPEGSAGALMSTEYADVQPEMPVSEALDHLRRIAPKSETIYTVYVVDAERRLVGVVSLLTLITARPGRRVADEMRTDVISVRPEVDREEVAHILSRYDFLALPVVDAGERLLGIVTLDVALDILEEEQTEDVQLASGIEPTETAYSRASVRLLLRKRAVWLEALLFAALISASVIAAFEERLASVVALAFYIPVVTGTGGNTGTQSAALVIRALATGDLRPGEWARVLAKEVAVGLMLGVVLALTIFLVGSAWPSARSVAPVVGATMVVLVLWANLVGALLPLLLRRLGVDPAVAGAPLVSTVVDATGLLIYFGMAALLLP